MKSKVFMRLYLLQVSVTQSSSTLKSNTLKPGRERGGILICVGNIHTKVLCNVRLAAA